MSTGVSNNLSKHASNVQWKSTRDGEWLLLWVVAGNRFHDLDLTEFIVCKLDHGQEIIHGTDTLLLY